MVFGRGTYFDGIDVGDAVAHEFTAATLAEITTQDLRAAVGDPCDPARRPVNVALSTLTLRHDRKAGVATFPLHRRDGATVGHAGSMYQVLPVGIFQPAGEQPWNAENDFSLWRCIVRELAEELRGKPNTTRPCAVSLGAGSPPQGAEVRAEVTSGTPTQPERESGRGKQHGGEARNAVKVSNALPCKSRVIR